MSNRVGVGDLVVLAGIREGESDTLLEAWGQFWRVTDLHFKPITKKHKRLPLMLVRAILVLAPEHSRGRRLSRPTIRMYMHDDKDYKIVAIAPFMQVLPQDYLDGEMYAT